MIACGYKLEVRMFPPYELRHLADRGTFPVVHRRGSKTRIALIVVVNNKIAKWVELRASALNPDNLLTSVKQARKGVRLIGIATDATLSVTVCQRTRKAGLPQHVLNRNKLRVTGAEGEHRAGWVK
ncbi:hypothetical protein CAQ69_21090 [Stutzerimonas stutzeri]|jgi:hypothetical protein|nr:hypothetical protein CAQ69_21090 [Stutzerimonas stutzeri]OZB32976.1 MAG: hypothetical protein B7X51_05120 [Pseudomonas sp. 34-62-33]